MAELAHFLRNPPLEAPRTAIPEAMGILAVTAHHERWREELGAASARLGKAVPIVDDAMNAKLSLACFPLVAVYVDPDLPDMSGYDLAGFIRAHYRDLELHILGDPDVDLDPVETDGGWTVHESLRARMTDLSVLVVTPDTMPVITVEYDAALQGVSVEEIERQRAKLLRESGFETMGEMLFHVRNAASDPDRGRH